MWILIIEDEQEMAGFIKQGLEERGHTVEHAANGRRGLEMALRDSYDAIVLDILLPGLIGFDVLQQIREQKVTVPVLLYSAIGGSDFKAEFEKYGLSLAQDYLAKPFDIDVLIRRVERLPSRRRALTAPFLLQVGDLMLDPSRHEVFRGDEKIDLTPLEFNLLEFLMENRGSAVGYESIADNVWKYEGAKNDTIQACISTLRKKIKDSRPDSKLIHTMGRVGYMIEER